MITRRQVFTTLALLTLATSCSRQPEPAPSPLPTPVRGPSDAGGETGENDEDHVTYAAAPTDAADSQSAGDHATATLEALWATDKTQDQWYADLAALMTPEGGEPFAYTQIENILPGRIAGHADVTFLDEGNTAEVSVPSDQGTWTLTLYRQPDGWLTESIRFPKER
ncbi:hypothetical protein V1260_15420 [Brachybacterium sp. J144]|uniref:hypothetical protein n=1 Tax=Brachybacterium sp. J144 TaxID=3116487 RepID=UPI002E78A4EC|nr:hypothetical protein [Brachybacterium sp. J144]MEE1652171.1 hypothetical protein [Brachybacterium sp. J144]